MPEAITAPEIFNRSRRKALMARAARRAGHDVFLWHHMADDLAERLACVNRDFGEVLIIGPLAYHAKRIMGNRNAAITCADVAIIEEDRLPYPAASFDLIITAGTLDSVNDLPGALIQMRRYLRPDGLLLGTLFGAGSLSTLKSVMLRADGAAAAAHIHPQIDLRNMADLLTRAGFALPVADQDILTVHYGSVAQLVCDLRDMGIGNVMTGKRPYLGKGGYARLLSAWQNKAGFDGKVAEKFVLLNISGWAPSTDQPKPAKRGSGTVSLASVLKLRTD